MSTLVDRELASQHFVATKENNLAGAIAKRIRTLMNWSQQDLSERLEVSRNYVALIETGRKKPSVRLLSQLEQLLTAVEKGSTGGEEKDTSMGYRKSGSPSTGVVREATSRSPTMINPRFQPRAEPSTKIDVQTYFNAYCDAAEATNDPDVFPSIMRQLKKHFPLEEFVAEKTEE